MSNLNNRSYSVIVTRTTEDATPVASVGRPILNCGNYVAKLLDIWGLNYASARVVTDFAGREEVNAILDRLRDSGVEIEGEEAQAQDARPRAEKFSALVGAMRSAGLRVTVRNGDIDGETKRLTINGSDEARASFMAVCSDDQEAWVKRTFVAVADRPELRYGVVSVVDA